MHVPIKTSYDEHLVIVLHRMASEEIFWLLQAALLPFDLVRLSVKAVAVRYPTVVSAKNQNFAVPQGETSNGVSGRPQTIFVDQLYLLPLLLLYINEPIQPFNRLQGCFCHTVTAANGI
jgi:hypothetical protein